MFQLPRHDDFADMSWQDVDVDSRYFADALTWGSLVVKDVSASGKFALPPDLVGSIRAGFPEPVRVDDHADWSLYAFGICAVRLRIESEVQLSRDVVASTGRFLDSLTDDLGRLAGVELGVSKSNSPAGVWNSYVIGTINDPLEARTSREIVAGITETAPLTEDGEVFQSVVGNKFSALSTREPDHFDQCLELFARAAVYAAGFYRYERLMIRELLRLAVNDRRGGRAPSETLSVHNGARILRALSTHQFLATPVNRRGVQRGLWSLWNMDQLTESVSELTEKVSAILGARRDERRNLLTSRLNWIVLAVAMLQILIAALDFFK
jgi:hypothetical protein